jgi:CHAT domain-containing protein
MGLARSCAIRLALLLSLTGVAPPAMAQLTEAQFQELQALETRFKQLYEANDFAGARMQAQKLEAAVKKLFGAEHEFYANMLSHVAVVARSQAKLGEAETLYTRALAIKEKALGSDSPKLVTELNGLANVREDQGRYAEAEALFKRVLAIREAVLGPRDLRTAATLDLLAGVYRKQARYREAEAAHQRALAIGQAAPGAHDVEVAASLSNLGELYRVQARYADAEALQKRALALLERAPDANALQLAGVLVNLGGVYYDQRRYDDAEAPFKRAIAIREKVLGPNHLRVGETLHNLAATYRARSQPADAASALRRALAIKYASLGANHPSLVITIDGLGNVAKGEGKYDDADRYYKLAFAILEKAWGSSHPDVADQLDNLAALEVARGRTVEALAYSRRAIGVVVGHAALTGELRTEEVGGPVAQRAQLFRSHVAYLAAAVGGGAADASGLGGREAFETAQWTQSSTAAAVQQMAARSAAGGGALAALVRESQDMAVRRREQEAALIAALGKADGQQDQKATDAIRLQLADLDKRRGALQARLEKEFPDFAALTSPKPLPVDEIQKLLRADEALVFWLAGYKDAKQTYVFAVTRDGFAWRALPLATADLESKVTAFRRGLDLEELGKSIEAGKPILFDLALAHELYATLLGPVDELIKGRKQLLVVPTGALTALPLHLLVTAASAGQPTVDNLKPYRDAAWLMKRQAVTVLPSVASLAALRVFARKDQAKKPLVGFGDPVFGTDTAEPAQRGTNTVAARKLTTRAFTDFWQGAGVDRDRLVQALPRLEDTADELKAVARKLGAPPGDIFLRADASEATVKRLTLADYRVVYFATHGLVAGDVKGLAEPSLALTIPKQASDLDDGLLTASEIAQLKLNADWVVLSACNTISGEKPGAEALSGLARAFFYAGARALLVSHWAVDSAAATRLASSTFDILKADPKLGRAEALRRATLAYLNDASDPRNAYPAYWAPFSIVGEGAAR